MYHLPTHCVIDQDISPLFYYERNMIHHNDIITCNDGDNDNGNMSIPAMYPYLSVPAGLPLPMPSHISRRNTTFSTSHLLSYCCPDCAPCRSLHFHLYCCHVIVQSLFS